MRIVIVTPTLFEKNSPFNHLFKDILMGLLKSGFKISRVVAVNNFDDADYKMGLDEIEYIPFIRKNTNQKRLVFFLLISDICKDNACTVFLLGRCAHRPCMGG